MNAFRGAWGGLAVSVLLLSGCPTDTPEGSVECGPNTKEVDGKCVSTVDEAPCGDGASRDPDTGQCEPDVQCGPGTTYSTETQRCEPDSRCGPNTTWNEATGECEPNVVCGDETVFDPETGACVPEVFCGEGTHRDEVSGECLPDPFCGEGTVFDEGTGACVPSLVCGPGLEEVDGVCLSALDLIVSEADAVEAIPDVNDPAFGGAPETLTVEPVGERAVLTGTIARPVDLDADEVVDQDVDVWRFTGRSGQLLRIRVASTGAFQPAFTLTGPNEYYREPQLGFSVDAEREVVLPYDGEYDLTVLPSLVLQGSEPIGGSDAVYAVVVEELAWPTPVSVPLSDSGEVALASGSTLGLLDNFFAIEASDSTPLRVGLTAPAGGTEPVLFLFTADGQLRAEVPGDASGDSVLANTVGFLSVELGLVAVVDWQTSNGVDVDFELSANPIATERIGEVPVDGGATLPAPFIPGYEGLGVTFEATAGQVIMTDFLGITVDVTLIAPSGTVVYSGAGPSSTSPGLFFYAQETGRYFWILLNTRGTDETPSIHVQSFTPYDAGSFDGVTAGTATFSGDVLKTEQRPGGAFVLVENTGPALLQVDFDWAYGMPDLEVYELGETGAVGERRSQTFSETRTIRALRTAPGRSLVRMAPGDLGDSPDPWTMDWSIDVQVLPIPDSEVEPNDALDATHDLGGTPVRVLGQVADEEIDLFTFTLGSPLESNEMLVIDAEYLNVPRLMRMHIRSPSGTLADAPLLSTSGGPIARWEMFPGSVPGPFVIEIEGGADEPETYVLEVKRVAVPNAEAEPNDTTGAPQDLGVLAVDDVPLRAFGTVSFVDKDVYQVALAQPLPAGTALRVRAENPEATSDDLILTLFDAAATELAMGTNNHIVLFTGVSSTDPFFIEVASTGEEDEIPYPYRLSLDVVENTEVEPNDTPGEASALAPLAPEGSTSVVGWDHRNETDVFVLPLDTPLVEGEAIAIRYRNVQDEGEFEVKVLDAGLVELGLSETWADELFVAPTGSSGPLYVQVTPLDSSWDPPEYPGIYELQVTRLSGVTVDVEPNDDTSTAQALEVPADVVGTFYDDDDDLFAITLDADVAPGERLILDGAVRYTDDYVTVAVLDNAGTVVASTSDLAPYLEVELPVTTAGTTYYVSVGASGSLSPDERYAYDLYVDVAVP